MRRICIFTLLASAISSSALAQSPQPGYANAAINQPYAGQAALAQQNYVVPQPHYVTPPPHYIVPQTSNVATPSADSALPPAPWNSRGGGLFGAIFGGPTVMAHVFRSFQPNSISAPQNGPPAYAAIDHIERDLLGRLRIHLRGHDHVLPVSRACAGLFKQM